MYGILGSSAPVWSGTRHSTNPVEGSCMMPPLIQTPWWRLHICLFAIHITICWSLKTPIFIFYKSCQNTKFYCFHPCFVSQINSSLVGDVRLLMLKFYVWLVQSIHHFFSAHRCVPTFSRLPSGNVAWQPKAGTQPAALMASKHHSFMKCIKSRWNTSNPHPIQIHESKTI